MYGSAPGAAAGQAIFTDDVSLQVFMEHLKRLVSIPYLLRMLLVAQEIGFRLSVPRQIDVPVYLVILCTCFASAKTRNLFFLPLTPEAVGVRKQSRNLLLRKCVR
jgi:hypothetical protein